MKPKPTDNRETSTREVETNKEEGELRQVLSRFQFEPCSALYDRNTKFSIYLVVCPD